jgi:sugar phosphate isomerase/epimerase
MEKDFLGTLEKVAKMGYKGVEFAGYNDIPADKMASTLKRLGLEAVSSHVPFDSLQNNLGRELDYLLKLGAKHITCPYADMDTKEKALKCAEILNKVGEKAKEAGLTLSYHNHAHEFKVDQGEYPLEVFFNNSPYVKQQPDLFWIAYAGLNPIDYLKKNINRCPLIHLKQIKDNQTKQNVDAGSGIIDFAEVKRIAKNSELIYEQEEFTKSSLEEVEKSLQFLLKI